MDKGQGIRPKWSLTLKTKSCLLSICNCPLLIDNFVVGNTIGWGKCNLQDMLVTGIRAHQDLS